MAKCIEFESDIQMLDHVIAGIPRKDKLSLAKKALRRKEYGPLKVLVQCKDISPEDIERLQKELKN